MRFKSALLSKSLRGGKQLHRMARRSSPYLKAGIKTAINMNPEDIMRGASAVAAGMSIPSQVALGPVGAVSGTMTGLHVANELRSLGKDAIKRYKGNLKQERGGRKFKITKAEIDNVRGLVEAGKSAREMVRKRPTFPEMEDE